MELNRSARAALVMMGMAGAFTASADAGGLAAGVKVGTTGLGVEAVTAITPMLNVRGVLNLFNYSYDTTEDDVEYKAKLKLQSFGAVLDVHPFKGSFRLSAGLLGNGNKADLNGRCPDTCEVGDLTVSGDNARVGGDIDFKSVAPYLGLGFGNAMSGTPGLYGIFDLGVLFQGKPKANLFASGTATVTDENGNTRSNVDLATDPDVQQAIAKEEASLQDDVKDYKFYPVLNVGIGYRFF